MFFLPYQSLATFFWNPIPNLFFEWQQPVYVSLVGDTTKSHDSEIHHFLHPKMTLRSQTSYNLESAIHNIESLKQRSKQRLCCRSKMIHIIKWNIHRILKFRYFTSNPSCCTCINRTIKFAGFKIPSNAQNIKIPACPLIWKPIIWIAHPVRDLDKLVKSIVIYNVMFCDRLLHSFLWPGKN